MAEESHVRSLANEILAQLGVASPVSKEHGDVLVHVPGNITLVRIPAGEFEMGSTLEGFGKEDPVHAVRISRDFVLGRYPVTNAQYGEYLKASGKKVEQPEFWDNRRFNQPEQPVVGVSWNDAQRFCEWAGCSLPTEAEWEYACRAGTTTAFSFGDQPESLDQYGWYDKNSGRQTQQVGTKLPNPWSLHDMHCNVWEWCQDWYDEYGKSPVVDPAGPASGEGRVLRGGSWCDRADICRSSVRDRSGPVNRDGSIGFRVARTL